MSSKGFLAVAQRWLFYLGEAAFLLCLFLLMSHVHLQTSAPGFKFWWLASSCQWFLSGAGGVSLQPSGIDHQIRTLRKGENCSPVMSCVHSTSPTSKKILRLDPSLPPPKGLLEVRSETNLLQRSAEPSSTTSLPLWAHSAVTSLVVLLRPQAVKGPDPCAPA